MKARAPRFNIKKVIANKPRWLAVVPYLEKWIPSPFYLLIHVTLGCQRSCKFCYQVNDPFFKKHQGIIAIPDFESILHQASRFLIKPHIHLFGGEPMEHPVFVRLLSLCKQYGFRPTLTTNGGHLLHYAQALVEANVPQINISIGAVWDTTHTPKNVLKFIRRYHPRVRVNLSYAITAESIQALERTVKRCSDLFNKGEIESFVCQHFSFDKNEISSARQFDIISLKKQLETIYARSLPFDFFTLPNINIEDIDGYYTNYDHPFVRKCYVPWLGLSVYPDLTVGPGGAAFHCAKAVGSMKSQTLLEIWRSKELRAFRQPLRRDLPEQCARCCQNSYY